MEQKYVKKDNLASRVIQQKALEGGEAVRHLHDMHLATHEARQLCRQWHGLVDDALHERLQLGGMCSCQHDARLARLQILAQCSIGHGRVGV